MLSNRDLFRLHNAQTSHSPLMLEVHHAEGCYITDVTGRRYMDLISGISVSSTGHRHPRVLQAIARQADAYLHTMVYGEYVQAPQVQLAQKLHNLLPTHPFFDQHPWASYFTNSGSEATEGAMKLAKRYTGRYRFVAFAGAYHGSTQGALSLLGAEDYKTAFRPLLPGVDVLSFNRHEDLSCITGETAAVFVEPVQSETGYVPAHIAFLQALRQRCTQTGTLLVADECQTGLGRTGKWFGFEHAGIVPDVILLAKALGAGLPMGAFVAPKPIMDSLSSNPVLGHITTFGGHPLCCAAALAGLAITEEENLPEKAAAAEQLFRQQLAGLPLNGIGLMLSIDLQSFDRCKTVINRCMAAGVLTDWFLHAPHKLRLSPPLTISTREINTVCRVIREAVD